MRLKWPKSYENPKKITRLKFKKITVYLLTCQKLTLTHFCSDSENKFLSLLLIEEIVKIFFFTFHICLNIFHMVKDNRIFADALYIFANVISNHLWRLLGFHCSWGINGSIDCRSESHLLSTNFRYASLIQ